MNYIGSKNKLSSFISETVTKVVGEDLSDKLFCDLFAGTGIVGRNFKTNVKQVIANDVEYYSFVLNRNYIGNYKGFHFEELLEKPYLSDLEIHEAIGHGEVYNDINEVAKNKEIDLIVMGSHGISGFKEMFIGSNTEKVVRTSNVPVLVIKNEHESFDITNFVFATDFSEKCCDSFEEAKKFSEDVNSQMNLLYVNTPGNFITTADATKKMNEFVKNIDIKNYTLNIYNDTSVEKGILNFAKETNASLIGMSTHGRKGISHFFNGSISEDLVNHANRPVITFKI